MDVGGVTGKSECEYDESTLYEMLKELVRIF